MVSREKTGKLIKTARLAKGYTLKDLASKVGNTPQQIQNYEQGKSYPSLKSIDKLVKALGVSIRKFIDDKETVDILDKAGKKFAKYNKILDMMEKDKELEDFLYYYAKNKERFKGIKIPKVLKRLSELSLTERKRVLKFING